MRLKLTTGLINSLYEFHLNTILQYDPYLCVPQLRNAPAKFSYVCLFLIPIPNPNLKVRRFSPCVASSQCWQTFLEKPRLKLFHYCINFCPKFSLEVFLLNEHVSDRSCDHTCDEMTQCLLKSALTAVSGLECNKASIGHTIAANCSLFHPASLKKSFLLVPRNSSPINSGAPGVTSFHMIFLFSMNFCSLTVENVLASKNFAGRS